jgi:hypothetical protein
LVTSKSGARTVRLAWPAKIAPSWRVPMLWLDGTLHEGVVRRWVPHLSVVADIRAEEAPGTVHRIVVVDRIVGKRTLDPSVAPQEWATVAATNRREDVARLARRLAFAHAPVGLITFQAVERVLAEALSDDIARDAVRLGHFNNVRGSNEFSMACAGILAGTLLPRVEAVEELAEILLGRPVRRLPRRTWYRLAPTPLRMRDGSLRLAWKMVHPDPDAHAVLEAIQSEMTQAAARWRPLDAGARGGLIEIVLGPPHGDVPVDAVLPLEAVLAGRTVPDALAACGLLPESREDLARLLGEAGEAAEERLKKRMAREGLTPRDLLRPEVEFADLGDICLNRLFQVNVPSRACCRIGSWSG